MTEKLEFKEIEIVNIKRITDAAILITLPDGLEKWIPRSTISFKDDIEIDGQLANYDKTSIRVVRWFCEQEEL